MASPRPNRSGCPWRRSSSWPSGWDETTGWPPRCGRRSGTRPGCSRPSWTSPSGSPRPRWTDGRGTSTTGASATRSASSCSTSAPTRGARSRPGVDGGRSSCGGRVRAAGLPRAPRQGGIGCRLPPRAAAGQAGRDRRSEFREEGRQLGARGPSGDGTLSARRRGRARRDASRLPTTHRRAGWARMPSAVSPRRRRGAGSRSGRAAVERRPEETVKARRRRRPFAPAPGRSGAGPRATWDPRSAPSSRSIVRSQLFGGCKAFRQHALHRY